LREDAQYLPAQLLTMHRVRLGVDPQTGHQFPEFTLILRRRPNTHFAKLHY
jgi:hypothetical protein